MLTKAANIILQTVYMFFQYCLTSVLLSNLQANAYFIFIQYLYLSILQGYQFMFVWSQETIKFNFIIKHTKSEWCIIWTKASHLMIKYKINIMYDIFYALRSGMSCHIFLKDSDNINSNDFQSWMFDIFDDRKKRKHV